MDYLLDYFSYTLEVGASYQHEKDKNGEEKLITKLYVNGIKDVVELEFDNKTKVTCTLGHKFLSLDNHWVLAEDIILNDEFNIINTCNDIQGKS